MTWLAEAYPWIKAAHIVSVVAWMAGLLYLPRLFVYHADARRGSSAAETLKVMERRLLRGIMHPAMVATYLFGILLLLTPGVVDWSRGWIHMKLGAVLGLTLIHGLLMHWQRRFAQDRHVPSARFFRVINEIPTVLLILIVIMVVVKPF
jgi:protoporphyrinogen IX oxidase